MHVLLAQDHKLCGMPISVTFKGKGKRKWEYQVKIAVEQIKGKLPLV